MMTFAHRIKQLIVMLLVGSQGVSSAQSLHDVVLSISDRHRVASQQAQVIVYLENQHNAPTATDPDLPPDNPLDWLGVGINPTRSSIEGLGIGGKIALLNQAVGVVDGLEFAFLNSSPAEFTPGAAVGALQPYDNGDFPTLPRATPENYHKLLRLLAQRVRSLQLIRWPAAFRHKSLNGSIAVQEVVATEDEEPSLEILTLDGEMVTDPVEWTPSSIGSSDFDVPPGEGNTQVLPSFHSTITVYGHRSERPSDTPEIPAPLRRQTIGVSATYPESAFVRATAPGGAGTQIGGTVYVLRRSAWHEFSMGSASPEYDVNEAGYVVEGGSDSGTVTLFDSPPSVRINGTWAVTQSPFEDEPHWVFVPGGYQYKAASVLPVDDGEYSDDFSKSYELNWKVGCVFNAVFKPTFTRGVDAQGMRAALEKADLVTAGNTADGELRLHPRPSLLFGIDLGPGLKGSGEGYVSIRPMISEHSVLGEGDFFSESDYSWRSMQRFDSSYAFQLAGSHSDYHVVYEKDRSLRSQSLPADGMGWPMDGENTQYDISTLYDAWDLPRLKQVAGRDLIADVTYNANHYGGYTVKIYRRPTVSAEPLPGQPFNLLGMTLIRTWVFSSPHGATAHPSSAEKLLVTGSGGENYEIQANQVLPNQGAGYLSWYGYSSYTPWLWTEGTHSWTLKLFQETIEKLRKEIKVTTINENDALKSETEMREYLDSQPISTFSSKEFNPFGEDLPVVSQIISAEKTITVTSVFNPSFTRWPSSVSIKYDGIQPDVDYTWDADGLLSSVIQGPWTMMGSVESGAYKQIHKYNSSTYSTDWTELPAGGNKVKTYSAADGNTGSKSDLSVASTEIEYGTATSGLPGLPLIVRKSDGTGATYGWNANASGAYTLTLEEGKLDGNSVSGGIKTIRAINAHGQPNKIEFYATPGGSLQTVGTEFSNFTAWGMPKTGKDFNTKLSSTWNYADDLTRLSTHTDSLGVVSNFSGYDVLGRPASVSNNGISAANTYTAFSISSSISGAATGSISENRDMLGRLTSSNTTWNGVTDNLNITPNASPVGIAHQSFLGSSSATLRRDDGSLQAASGPTLPFGGTEGTSLTVDGGLFKSTAELGDQSATFQTTWTDAWGRIRKTTTASGTTDLLYSDSSSSLKRVRINEPTGRKTITESDPYNAAGAITRSGIDVNGNGSLGASDRYVESITTVSGSNLVTTLNLTEDSGLREILRTEWNPSGNVTVTKINGNEETITRTPNYTAKTITTSSSKGWSKTESFNDLGLATSSGLSGGGIPGADFTPAWRADGSLENLSVSIGGKTHSASFNNNGTLASLTAPGRGNILDGHSISNGIETLGVDGVSVTSKLDGTEETTSGGDVIGKTETLATSGSGFKHTTTPAVGAATEVVMNSAGAPVAKNYAAGAGEAYTSYPGGLLHTITLARGGSLEFGYSSDGAKDLTSAIWPAVSSGALTIPAITEGYGYDRAGRMDEIGDSSGVRGILYQNGTLKQTTWNSGLLAGYRIVKGLDDYGRDTGFELYRGNTLVHSAVKAPNGVSGEISGISSGAFNATFGRDAARNLTSLTRGSITQTWTRDGGRITAAGSSVSGAPSFAYTEFDPNGRRKKCTTTGAVWAYTYTNGRLTNAAHPTLGNFTYQFDAIGRRTENSANTSDLLNRTLGWTNSQNKTLKVAAHPDARVWVNGTEIPSFTGNYSYAITPPGTSGGWVPWHTLAVLEGEGDAGANPDAKAEQSGAVWIPPVSESFTYDAAGNRESSAQWDFGWNAKNELARARTKNHNSAVQGYDITNAYDAEGRRFSKKVNRYQNGSVVEQKVITFLHDRDDIIYERHQLPSGLTLLERKYVWGPDLAGGAGGLLLIRETKGNVTTDLYPLYDGTGHVVALADSAGTLQAEYAYGPFGEPIYARGPKASSCPFRFQTKYLDEETGLYNFGRRFLDPITGQWLSREPLGESESLNLYALTGNDPINRVDAQGLAAIDISKDVTALQTQLGEAMAILAKVGSTTVPISDEGLESMYANFLEKYTAYLTGVSKLQAKVTANEVSGNGMLEGWWHSDALSRNRASAFGMQLVPDDDSVTGLIPSGLLSNSLDRSRQFSEIISGKYESDAEFAAVIAHELEKRQREVNYASAALGVGAIVNTAGRIAITEGGSATIGYLTKVAGGYAISYAGAAATEFGIDQAHKNGLVTANQATATRMGIALFQIVVAKRQARAEAKAKAPLGRMFDGYGPEQGFPGVFDPRTGNIMLKPSSSNTPLPDGFVPRRMGHARIAREMGQHSDQLGFTAFPASRNSLRLEWHSGSVNEINPHFEGTIVPESLRPAIIKALRSATGRTIK